MGRKVLTVDQTPWSDQSHSHTGRNGDTRKEKTVIDHTDLVPNPAKSVAPLAWDSSRVFGQFGSSSQHTGGYLAEGPLDRRTDGKSAGIILRFEWTWRCATRGVIAAVTATPPEPGMVDKKQPVASLESGVAHVRTVVKNQGVVSDRLVCRRVGVLATEGVEEIGWRTERTEQWQGLRSSLVICLGRWRHLLVRGSGLLGGRANCKEIRVEREESRGTFRWCEI
jgi:hypothetical protein